MKLSLQVAYPCTDLPNKSDLDAVVGDLRLELSRVQRSGMLLAAQVAYQTPGRRSGDQVLQLLALGKHARNQHSFTLIPASRRLGRGPIFTCGNFLS